MDREQAILRGYGELATPARALATANELLRRDPADSAALRLLGAARRRTGALEEAIDAERRSIAASRGDAGLIAAARTIEARKVPAAERMLKERLARDPFDVVAIRLLATLAMLVEEEAKAAEWLRRALEIMPSYAEARADLALALAATGDAEGALRCYDELVEAGELTSARRLARANLLMNVGQHEAAIADYEAVLADDGENVLAWNAIGLARGTIGEREGAIAAYRRAAALFPAAGEAWWNLSNLKTVRFTDDDVAAMERALAGGETDPMDRIQLYFALGKAHEDRGDADAAWRHLAAGNRLRLKQTPYSATAETRLVDRTIALATPAFFADRAGAGAESGAPIFIVGMPRSGSTLLEQILASHSMVEGTRELHEIIDIARGIGDRAGARADDNYPANIAGLALERLRELGERYLDATRIHRLEGRARFIDKMPNNWQHVALIRLILPNAKIVDARRDPLDCGWSNFKQHFARGQDFTYNLADFGRYYRDYVRLMDHIDTVQPGRVHRFLHERLLDEPEREVRAVLEYLGLPFEPGCLDFHANRRAVRTPSAEQVRRPLNRDAVGRWRAYEPWLAPLKQALGPALETWDRLQPWQVGATG
ncbi:sulfotransferase [Sphingomonas sp. ASV193]|uniref:tetratricopeptide repeat-containing sulfotransferase family protein n=1 Tax=Sphingomonas sp. ASV193 TaxID=3144405 RepID=UPI0032E8F613